MSMNRDVSIVGGGVIGLTTAYYLAREGIRVEVVEKSDFGQEASWAGAGIIPPGDPAKAQGAGAVLRAHSSAAFPALSAELHERTSIDNGYVRCGGMEFIDEQEDQHSNEWRSEGVAFRHLTREAVRQLEPGLDPGLGPAYHLPDMAQHRNPRHPKATI